MSLANIFTQILNILISMGVQPDKVDINPAMIVGILIVVSSVFTYTHLKTNKNACWGIMLSKDTPAASAS